MNGEFWHDAGVAAAGGLGLGIGLGIAALFWGRLRRTFRNGDK